MNFIVLFVNDLYYSMTDIKWLLFEKYENTRVIMYLDIVHDIYNVYDIIDNSQNSKWLLLDENKNNCNCAKRTFEDLK